MLKLLPLLVLCYPFQLTAQNYSVTLSGVIVDSSTRETLPFSQVVLRTIEDSSFVMGTISNDQGIFTFESVLPADYILDISSFDYASRKMSIYVGNSSKFIDLGTIELKLSIQDVGGVTITAKQDAIGSRMDKKTFSVDDNISQNGGSLLQAMENLPGITISENKVQLRGSDKVIILIDGKQSALTGIGGQSGLDNIPASSIERIEIINNPSAKFDANGNAGIINVILKKEKKDGFNGKIGVAGGVGALWVKKENLPTIRPQYQFTPKVNPSISLNYRKNKVNVFFQFDDLYTETLNKNEFVTRVYDDGTTIYQQSKRNRNTNFLTSKLGIDWFMNDRNQFTISGMYGSETIIDNGDQPFFDGETDERIRLWQFLEDEVKTTVIGNMNYQHKFKVPGRYLSTGLNYTFHREDEQYFFTNTLPIYTGEEAFKLLSDEHIGDFNLDYVHPIKSGKIESGIKLRYRAIPTNMEFFSSAISPIDSTAGGAATYKELIPALYTNYSFDRKKWEGEFGLRVEYVQLNYEVNPDHNTYASDGYNYFQPFPTMRLGFKVNKQNKLVLFYNRRVDRPREVDIRIFPKYDDAEIIKVGNPALAPQFTYTVELGYRNKFKNGYWYSSLYSRFSESTITRISTTVDTSNLIYAIFQNAGTSNISGLESLVSHEVSKFFSYNLGVNVYYAQIDAFTVQNLYPVPHEFTAEKQSIISGNAKINMSFHFKNNFDMQLTAIYLAPDILPQGRIDARFSLNFGLKKKIQKGKGEITFNASDLLNTMVIRTEIDGNNFSYTTANYYETQVIRLGYSYKF
jgi:outer membrane receptor protein involved in Fe transport